MSDDLTLAGSARTDFHSEHGTQFSPRLSMLYRRGPWKIRASLGRGFYAPTPFVEETEAAGLSRLEPIDRLNAETAQTDAALSMCRARLADEVFHRAVNGTVDQIWKDGEVVAERHRHDNRLSIAVLNRLDSRADCAERTGAPTLRLAAEWGAYLAALADDRIADSQALLDPPLLVPASPVHAKVGEGDKSTLIHQLHQLHQLRAGKALDETDDLNVAEDEDDQRVWIAKHTWRTNFPRPTISLATRTATMATTITTASAPLTNGRCSTAASPMRSATIARRRSRQTRPNATLGSPNWPLNRR